MTTTEDALVMLEEARALASEASNVLASEAMATEDHKTAELLTYAALKAEVAMWGLEAAETATEAAEEETHP